MKYFQPRFFLVLLLSSILISCGSKPQESTSKPTQTSVESSDISQAKQKTRSQQSAKVDDNPARLLYGSGLYISNYNFADAIPKLEQSLKITQESGDLDMQLNSLLMLGIANLGDEQYNDAINYLEQHLALLKNQGKANSDDNATLLFLGKAHHQQGNYSEALKAFQDLEKLAEETNDLGDIRSAYLSLGNVYGAMGDYDKAVSYAEKMLANSASLDQNELGDANALMGTALWKLNKLPESETYLTKAYEAFERSRTEKSNVTKQASSFGVPSFFDLSDFERLNFINREKHEVETFETSASTAALLQQVLIDNNLPEKALEASESGRARVTIDLLEKKLASNSTPEASTQDPMANYCQQINQQADQLSSEQLKLIQQSINCDQFKQEDVAPSSTSSIKSLTIEEIKRIAKQQDITIVEYSIIRDKSFGKFQGKEDRLLIWVVQPTGEVIFEEVDLSKRDTSLEDLTNNWHQGVASGSSDHKSLKELHKLLIDPIAKSLPKDKDAEVVFIPHESMFLVPFAALQNWWGKYLIQEHTISTSPAIEFLDLASQKSKALQQANSTSNAMLVVGNPEMPADLVSLPGAEQEARDIAQILNIQPVIGSQATETSVLEQISQSNRLHFATHAVIDHEDIKDLDIPGAIALTPDSSNDGWLTSSEIFDLQLNADLVVLSACETARGDIRDDGVIGLSRSFISAGTPSVVASLWTIPDAPTATLMTSFYENLDEKINKAQALRSAMLETMKEHKEPYNWAAFSLIGESN